MKFKQIYLGFLNNPMRCRSMDQQNLLRSSFVFTNGFSNTWAWNIHIRTNPFIKGAPSSKLLKSIDEEEIQVAVKSLNINGYWVLPDLLSSEMVSNLNGYLSSLEVVSRKNPSDVQKADKVIPEGAVYDFKTTDLINHPIVRDLVKDEILLEIVGRYLKCKPVLDGVWGWKSFPQHEACSASAQLYHFDLDRIRWLKVFVYLNDVDETNGPHVFIKGSHNDSGKFAKHHGRFSDEEVFNYYSTEKAITFTGKAGTVFIEDTMGIHKGCPLIKGERTLLEFQYSVSYFGYPYPEIELTV